MGSPFNRTFTDTKSEHFEDEREIPQQLQSGNPDEKPAGQEGEDDNPPNGGEPGGDGGDGEGKYPSTLDPSIFLPYDHFDDEDGNANYDGGEWVILSYDDGADEQPTSPD